MVPPLSENLEKKLRTPRGEEAERELKEVWA